MSRPGEDLLKFEALGLLGGEVVVEGLLIGFGDIVVLIEEFFDVIILIQG